jgi:hypothetical protein
MHSWKVTGVICLVTRNGLMNFNESTRFGWDIYWLSSMSLVDSRV